MRRELRPDDLAPPAANYAHAVLSSDVQRMLHTSGVVPTRPDGTIPETIAEQAEVIWQTLSTLLVDAEMGPENIVSVTTYVVVDHMSGLTEVMAARDRVLGGHRAASTLVTVPALANADWLMEISVVATG
ncbi:MAG: 2-iminobutanoate/2-iminopropanoate deaminase [Acidimicrobiales bacterium]|jgi:2-iminobutanoate/2-iminopropanoate deaminase